MSDASNLPARWRFQRPSVLSGKSAMGPRVSDASILVSIDFAAFADRSDEERRAMREALYSLVERSFTEEGIDWSTCLHDDRGDGILIVVPQHAPRDVVLTNVLMTSLPALLARYNDAATGFAELWLRIAVHIGDVRKDARGLLSSFQQAWRGC